MLRRSCPLATICLDACPRRTLVTCVAPNRCPTLATHDRIWRAITTGPGTDFLASRDKDVDVYRTELEVTSRINRYLSDTAFRNIALGANYFRLLALEYEAPRVCAD